MKKSFQRFMNFLSKPKSSMGLLAVLVLLFCAFIITDNKYSADSATLSKQININSSLDQNFIDKSALEPQQVSDRTLAASAYARVIIIILFSFISVLTIITLIWSYVHPKDILPSTNGTH